MAWFILLAVALVYSAFMQMRARRMDARMERVLRRVDAVLTIWADNWGEPPDAVKTKLLDALTQWKSSQEI